MHMKEEVQILGVTVELTTFSSEEFIRSRVS